MKGPYFSPDDTVFKDGRISLSRTPWIRCESSECFDCPRCLVSPKHASSQAAKVRELIRHLEISVLFAVGPKRWVHNGEWKGNDLTALRLSLFGRKAERASSLQAMEIPIFFSIIMTSNNLFSSQLHDLAPAHGCTGLRERNLPCYCKTYMYTSVQN